MAPKQMLRCVKSGLSITRGRGEVETDRNRCDTYPSYLPFRKFLP